MVLQIGDRVEAYQIELNCRIVQGFSPVIIDLMIPEKIFPFVDLLPRYREG
jgi:hypothetical protein